MCELECESWSKQCTGGNRGQRVLGWFWGRIWMRRVRSSRPKSSLSPDVKTSLGRVDLIGQVEEAAELARRRGSGGNGEGGGSGNQGIQDQDRRDCFPGNHLRNGWANGWKPAAWHFGFELGELLIPKENQEHMWHVCVWCVEMRQGNQRCTGGWWNQVFHKTKKPTRKKTILTTSSPKVQFLLSAHCPHYILRETETQLDITSYWLKKKKLIARKFNHIFITWFIEYMCDLLISFTTKKVTNNCNHSLG